MKIIDGMKLKGEGVEIPGAKRKDLPGFLKEMGFEVGVEVGVFRGAFTEFFAKAGFERIYGVDPWKIYPGFHVSNTEVQDKLDHYYEISKRRLASYRNVTLIKKTSTDAAEGFTDRSLDFVYIDGNHSFKHVITDLCNWYGKVKVGGIICGDDYISSQTSLNYVVVPQVKKAVDAFTRAFEIKNWYILGSLDDADVEYHRQWLWKKE